MMKISINILGESLIKESCEVKIFKGNVFFDTIRLFSATSEPFEEQTLYLISDHDLKQLNSDAFPSKILFYTNQWPTPELPLQLHDHVAIICHHDLPTFDLFSCTLQILLSFHQLSDQLIFALSHNQGIEKLVAIVHTYLGNPCTIVDNSQKIIAYTHDDHCKDEIWHESIQRGYIAFNSEDSSGLLDLQRSYAKNAQPNLIERATLHQPFLSCPIYFDEKIIGSFNLMAANREITPADIDLSQYFCEILSLELGKNEQILHNNGTLYATLIIDLLEREWTDDTTIKKRFQILNWNLKKNLYILVMVPHQTAITNPLLATICQQLEAVLPTSKSVVYEHQIITLIDTEKNQVFSQNTRERLVEFIHNNRLKAGISQCYQQISQTSKAYQRTRNTIKIGISQEPQKDLYCYTDYTFQYLKDILSEHEDLYAFCHPGLLSLKIYDEKHQASLRDTLFHFLLSDKSPTITSKKLDIHRSTLVYRLKKIEEIMDINLNNPEDVFAIWLSFKLLEYSEFSL